jgi:hypothetical protein
VSHVNQIFFVFFVWKQIFKNNKKQILKNNSIYKKGSVKPGLVVRAEGSCPKGCRFESWSQSYKIILSY